MSVRKCKRKSKCRQPWNDCYVDHRNLSWVHMCDEWCNFLGSSSLVHFLETSFYEKPVLEESSVSSIGSMPNKIDRRRRSPLAANIHDDSSPEVIILDLSMYLMPSQSNSQCKQKILSKGHAVVENNKLDEYKKYEQKFKHINNVLNRKNFAFFNP